MKVVYSVISLHGTKSSYFVGCRGNALASILNSLPSSDDVSGVSKNDPDDRAYRAAVLYDNWHTGMCSGVSHFQGHPVKCPF